MELEKTNNGLVHDHPMPEVFTIARIAERWSVKYNTPADTKYVLGYYRRGLQFCTLNIPTGTYDNYSRKDLIEEVHKKECCFGPSNFVKRLPEYESENLMVRKDDLLAFETIIDDIKLKAGYLKDKIPAPLCRGERFTEEEMKLTTLTKYLYFETWTPIEAAMLVRGLCPPHDCNQVMPNYAKGLEGAQVDDESDTRFKNARRVLELWNSQEIAPAKIRPADFVAWCKTKQINTDWLRDIELAKSQVELKAQSKRPLSQHRWQEGEILRVIRELRHDNQALPKASKGMRGVKSEIKLILTDSRAGTAWQGTVFNKAWQRLRDDGLIA